MAPIERHSLHIEIMRRLRDMIVEGRLRPGERIAELDVAAEIGVSRTPLREALKVLASEGLVELLPSRGAVVKRVSPREAEDMLKLMGELEAFAGREAAARATDAELTAIAALHRQMLGHYSAGRRRDYFRTNQAIHDAIVAAAGNSALAETHRVLSARMKPLRFAGSNTRDHWHDAVAEHEKMLKALTARDRAALARTLRQHQLATWSRIRPLIEEEAAAEATSATAGRARRTAA